MKIITLLASFLFVVNSRATAQDSFNYFVQLQPVSIPGLPGLHSYAHAQHNGKWLIVGGRKDGLHPRQPFSSFPSASNNTDIYVIDIASKQFWSASVNTLPVNMQEQLQATNINFIQREDTLYLIGGYAYSATVADHITFPYLTTMRVSGVIDAVINNTSLAPYCKQATDPIFAVTGGHLGFVDNMFYLVGGHRFDGRYNPMGNPTYVQAYTNQVQKFGINNSGSQPAIYSYSAITDPVHLHRRDYNLLPQIFPDGTEGYTIFSGVFQLNVDLPFLYPVDITANGYNPVTAFNQYLNNYHSAKVSLYDSTQNAMHNIFFGGISQYYYQNGTLIKDDNVPFVKTISRVSRAADGTMKEYRFSTEMPSLKGSSAEFIHNYSVKHYASDVIKLSAHTEDTLLIGHIYGGIYSPSLNPFGANQTSTTAADNIIYEVRLVKGWDTGLQPVDGVNPFDCEVFPNPSSGKLYIKPSGKNFQKAAYYILSGDGKILQKDILHSSQLVNDRFTIDMPENTSSQQLYLTIIFDDVQYVHKKLVKY